MSQMNPQIVPPPFGIPNYQEMQSAFKIIQQQQQQQMWYQQQYNQFIIFCDSRGLNPNDQNSFTLFYQQMMGNVPASHNPYPPQHQTQIVQPPIYNPPFSGGGNGTVSNNNNDIYIHDSGELKEIPPNPDQSVYIGSNQPKNINIMFKAGSNFGDVMLSIPENITVKEMFERYVQRLGFSLDLLKSLQFLYNGCKIDIYSNDLVSSKFKDGLNITVFDEREVIGPLILKKYS